MRGKARRRGSQESDPVRRGVPEPPGGGDGGRGVTRSEADCPLQRAALVSGRRFNRVSLSIIVVAASMFFFFPPFSLIYKNLRPSFAIKGGGG